MVLNEKYSLFLVQHTGAISVVLSEGLSVGVGNSVDLFDFTNDGCCVPIAHRLLSTVGNLFTLDEDGAVKLDVSGPNDFGNIRYEAKSKPIMFTEEIGLRLDKQRSGRILLNAVNARGSIICCGTLLSFNPDGFVKHMKSVRPSFFQVDSFKRIRLPSKKKTVMGYQGIRNGDVVTIGCLNFSVELIREINAVLKAKSTRKATIDLGGTYILTVAYAEVCLDSYEDWYNRAETAEALDKILEDDQCLKTGGDIKI